jgi:integrase
MASRPRTTATVIRPRRVTITSCRWCPATRYLQGRLQRLGLPRQRFHDLRHAFATLMIEGGEDLGIVSRILGHADFATTADVYAHLTPAMLDRAAERMSEILGS